MYVYVRNDQQAPHLTEMEAATGGNGPNGMPECHLLRGITIEVLVVQGNATGRARWAEFQRLPPSFRARQEELSQQCPISEVNYAGGVVGVKKHADRSVHYRLPA
jgi:hypothetical protein